MHFSRFFRAIRLTRHPRSSTRGAGPSGYTPATKFGYPLVEGLEGTEVEFLDPAGRALVRRDLARRLVTGKIGNPVRGATVRERDGDERCPKVVRGDVLPRVGVLEELGAIDPRRGQVHLAELPHEVARVLDLGKHARGLPWLALQHVPSRERRDDGGIEGPRAGVVRLVRVEPFRAPLEV